MRLATTTVDSLPLGWQQVQSLQASLVQGEGQGHLPAHGNIHEATNKNNDTSRIVGFDTSSLSNHPQLQTQQTPFIFYLIYEILKMKKLTLGVVEYYYLLTGFETMCQV